MPRWVPQTAISLLKTNGSDFIGDVLFYRVKYVDVLDYNYKLEVIFVLILVFILWEIYLGLFDGTIHQPMS